MPRTTFYVVQHEGAWRIRQGNRYSPPHDSRAVALRKATAFARWLGADSEILVESGNGRFVPASGEGLNLPGDRTAAAGS